MILSIQFPVKKKMIVMAIRSIAAVMSICIFEAGSSEMDGAVALKFAARAMLKEKKELILPEASASRKIIHALKDKIVSARILANPGKNQRAD